MGCTPAVGSHRGGLSLEEQEESSIRDVKAGTTVLKVIRGTLQVQIAAATTCKWLIAALHKPVMRIQAGCAANSLCYRPA
jgi:hypothetical protein